MVRYLERTGDDRPVYQRVILTTYARNVLTPHADARHDFVNKYYDDTAWWGLGWLEAARYELHYRHDLRHARTFLRLAESDADVLANSSRRCGGIEWARGYPPDTIANAEFVTLAAGLYRFRYAPGPFSKRQRAQKWLREAQATLGWMSDVKLIDLRTGMLADRLARTCAQRVGGPMTYTEGEVAEALTELGAALHDRSYFALADRFLAYATSGKSGMVSGGVIQEPCEGRPDMCVGATRRGDLPAYKGILIQALSDWSRATGSRTYAGFLHAQARAILDHATLDGELRPARCLTPRTCQFGFYWNAVRAPRRRWVGIGSAAQSSAIDALTAALSA